MSLGQVDYARIKKRLFVQLMALSLLLLGAAIAAGWWIITRQSVFVNQLIIALAGVVLVFFFLMLVIGLSALVWSIWRSRSVTSLQSVMYTATNALFPLALHIGGWLGLEQERIKNSYIQVSNQLVKVRQSGHPLGKLLILAPHCLQESRCPHKVTVSAANCRRCGSCSVTSLIDLAQGYQAELRLVSGGTAARKVIKDTKPEGVVAIACERDLTSGIQDCAGLPVLGVINERPEGPCHNTRVSLIKVEEALKYLKKGG